MKPSNLSGMVFLALTFLLILPEITYSQTKRTYINGRVYENDPADMDKFYIRGGIGWNTGRGYGAVGYNPQIHLFLGKTLCLSGLYMAPFSNKFSDRGVRELNENNQLKVPVKSAMYYEGGLTIFLSNSINTSSEDIIMTNRETVTGNIRTTEKIWVNVNVPKATRLGLRGGYRFNRFTPDHTVASGNFGFKPDSTSTVNMSTTWVSSAYAGLSITSIVNTKVTTVQYGYRRNFTYNCFYLDFLYGLEADAFFFTGTLGSPVTYTGTDLPVFDRYGGRLGYEMLQGSNTFFHGGFGFRIEAGFQPLYNIIELEETNPDNTLGRFYLFSELDIYLSR